MEHEVGDDSVEGAVLVSLGLLSLGQSVEVVHCLGHCISKQTNLNPASGLASDLDVKEDLLGDQGVAGVHPRVAVAAGDDDDEARDSPEAAQHLHQGSGL